MSRSASRQKIYDLFCLGSTTSEIADMLGKSLSTVQHALQKLGVDNAPYFSQNRTKLAEKALQFDLDVNAVMCYLNLNEAQALHVCNYARQCNEENRDIDSSVYNPSPQEIEEKCKEIQSGWSIEEEHNRLRPNDHSLSNWSETHDHLYELYRRVHSWNRIRIRTGAFNNGI